MTETKFPLPVAGYTPQPQEKIDLVNDNKHLEEMVLRQLDVVAGLMSEHRMDVDGRWLAIARTHIEQGFMALNRAIFKPKRIKGEF